MNKQKEMKVWKKIFGLEIGDKVLIVDVWDKCLLNIMSGKSIVGQKGIIIEIEKLYANPNEQILYGFPSKNFIPYLTYKVRFQDESCYHFIDSDLEYLG